MKVAVIGAGVIGVTTAWALARRGAEVTLLEALEDVALETSYANGGQLSFSHAEPWANPRTLACALKQLGKKEAFIKLSPKWDWAQWQWLFRLLLSCREDKAKSTTANLLRLSLYSRECLHRMLSETPVEFSHLTKGTLHVFDDASALKQAVQQAKFMGTLGCPFEYVDKEELIRRQPALTHSRRKLDGALFFPLDESGDAYVFTRSMARELKNNPQVKILCGRFVQGIEIEHGKLNKIITPHEEIVTDAIVLASGTGSVKLLKQLRVRLPVYPMKGYSVTLPLHEMTPAPTIAITDTARKMVYSRLGNSLRVAGMAEIGSINREVNANRGRLLVDSALELFPGLSAPAMPEYWAGFRPATPDGAPLIGASGIKGVWLNTGHGTLGWTLSAGSAAVLADMVEGKRPECDVKAFGIERF